MKIRESNDPPTSKTMRFARSLIKYGTTDFAIKYFPSLGPFVVPSYAAVAAYEFCHTTDLARKRDLLVLGLSWRYQGVSGLPLLNTSTFFVVEFLHVLLGCIGKTGESIRDCNNKTALVSLLCINEPHAVDECVLRKCEPYLVDAPKHVPVHQLLYGLCLNDELSWELRNEIMMTTVLIKLPDEIEPYGKSERENKKYEETTSQFSHSEASHVLGTFQFLEKTKYPDPSKACLDSPHFEYKLYEVI